MQFKENVAFLREVVFLKLDNLEVSYADVSQGPSWHGKGT